MPDLPPWIAPGVSAVLAVFSGVAAWVSARNERKARLAEARAADERSRRDYLQSAVKPTTDALVYAADDLQRRLYNITQLEFFEAYSDRGTEHQRRNASVYTLFLFAQVFGWMEAVRRGVLFDELAKVQTADGAVHATP